MRRLIALTLWAIVVVAGLLIMQPTQPTQGQTGIWPDELVLWDGVDSVTQTVQTQGVRAVGADYQYVFYSSGNSSITGTFMITVTRTWFGKTYQTLSASATISPGGVGTTGMITVATGSPYIPTALVQVNISAGAVTPTISFVGQ